MSLVRAQYRPFRVCLPVIGLTTNGGFKGASIEQPILPFVNLTVELAISGGMIGEWVKCCLGLLRVPQTPMGRAGRRPTTRVGIILLSRMALERSVGGVGFIFCDASQKMKKRRLSVICLKTSLQVELFQGDRNSSPFTVWSECGAA